ncbi:precorrin-6A reductase [Palleronia marisminoris]|uniref:Precorrin-6A reductase n=1 Tax=Palleronia marisminoris TaxID=315423 RepID=A0A1Y5TQE8_9RHOB|nr:cobalt-precorrin-6A reductase [Palleronia marisminoris]SFH44239.1 precorrin-6A reductase [Palleronia marisminoris]SLN67298.1 Precorrin-6A reductase [Palleronia marisminoris]
MEAPNVLILGGTTEATALCRAMTDAGVAGTISFAGRVERPVRQPLPQRVGGFGGIPGLVAYLRENRITHLIDATHPFAAQMSIHAVAAAAEAGVPLLALTRPAWDPQPGDSWVRVPDLVGAVRALDGPRRRVMLAIGRMHLGLFAHHPQHFYLLRLVDPPDGPLPVPDAHVEVSRGPFTLQDDRALIERHAIDLIVSKNAGGNGARAKIDAARVMGLPVVMIDRPALPPRIEVHEVAAALEWLHA